MNYSDIKSHAMEAEKVWGEAYDILWPLIKKKNLRVGAEIGVAFGGHSERILSKTRATLYCIDPYKHFDGYDDAMNMENHEFNRLYKYTKQRLEKFGNRAILIRKTSNEATNYINGLLDFVYIDGDHSEKGVREDILNWFPRLSDNGIIAGHDYGHPNFPGVKKVVDAFFGRFNWEIHSHPSGVWWVLKKPLNISYIMPAFNCEKTIRSSVESIYDGNHSDGDELIIVNDSSTDSTKQVISQLSQKHKSIKIVDHKYHKGGGAARNTAVEQAANEIVFCLDSDNILEKQSVPGLKKLLINTSTDIASFQKLKYFKNKISEVDHEWKFEKNTYDASQYLAGQKVPGASGNYLFTKKSWILSGRYPEHTFLDTWGFGLRQVMSGYSIAILPNSHYYHRYGYESYWVRESKNNNMSIRALTLLLEYSQHLSKQDMRYLLRNKETWLDKLDKHPIHLKSNKDVNPGEVKSSFLGKTYTALVSTFMKIFNILQIKYGQKIDINEEASDTSSQKELNWDNCDSKSNGEFSILNQYASSWTVFFDIGSNHGEYAAEIIKVNKKCKVYCFEPNVHLISDIKAKGLKKVFNYAVGSKTGKETININLNDDTQSSAFRLNQNTLSKSIRSITLDDFTTKHQIDHIDYKFLT